MRAIAIRGDKKRGAEVIALLEMLGGQNYNKCGDCSYNYYHFTPQNSITFNELPYDENIYKLYTLEEFWEEFPYKVGDKVHIPRHNIDGEVCGMFWEPDEETIYYRCLCGRNCNPVERAEDLLPITNKEPEPINIAEILKDAPIGTKLYSPLCGELKFGGILYDRDYATSIIAANRIKGGAPIEFYANGKYYNCEDGECLIFPSKDNRDWATFNIEPQFPTNINDCGDMLGFNRLQDEQDYRREGLDALRKLLICRDAWWKVDGNWEPNWADSDTDKWVIEHYHEDIRVDAYTNSNYILAFRTEEICEKFLETFRDLIEKCKDLL